MTLEIIDKNKVPPGGLWVYVDPDTGEKITHPYYTGVMSLARQHRIANNLPLGAEWLAKFDANLCANAASGVCRDTEPPKPPTRIEMMISFAMSMAGWLASGFAVVQREEFLTRTNICHDCVYWAGDGAAFGLGKCSKCGCSGLKLFLKTEKCPVKKW